MKNLSLNAKIYFVIAVLIFASGASSLLGIDRMGDLNGEVNKLADLNFPRVLGLMELRDDLRRIAVEERNILILTDAEEMKQCHEKYLDAKRSLDTEYDKLLEIASEEGRKRLPEFRKEFDEYWTLAEKAVAFGLKNDMKNGYEVAKQGSLARLRAIDKLEELLDVNKQRLVEAKKSTDDMYFSARNILIIVGAAAAIAGFFLAFFIMRALSKAIDRVIGNLTEASQQVAQSSSQIAQASEELSQASSEQAAALEETSASVEELASMVAKNTENAKTAAECAHRSLESAEKGKATIEGMVGAIQELEQTNQKIADMVRVFSEIQEKTKVIEDIVFQTQLLSFNASVEAARAGEHGKGFAVVAEEVGNLAEMSGNASGEIGSLLENSLKQVESTVTEVRTKVERLVSEGRSGIVVLEEIVREAQTSSLKTTEIADASAEQNRGIQEITRAMTQLDQGTQVNSATSEETASSAEELSSQAGALQGTVTELVGVIHGAHKADELSHASASTSHKHEKAPAKSKAHGKVMNLHSEKATLPKAALKKASGGDFPSDDDSGFVNL